MLTVDWKCLAQTIKKIAVQYGWNFGDTIVTKFRDPRNVMLMDVRAEVDVAKEMPGWTLMCPSVKKRLVDENGFS